MTVLMNRRNQREELLWSLGVLRHVYAPGNPFDIGYVETPLWISGLRENVVNRSVDSQFKNLPSIGTAVSLRNQYVPQRFPMFCRSKGRTSRLFKVASFTKNAVCKRWNFPATSAQAFGNQSMLAFCGEVGHFYSVGRNTSVASLNLSLREKNSAHRSTRRFTASPHFQSSCFSAFGAFLFCLHSTKPLSVLRSLESPTLAQRSGLYLIDRPALPAAALPQESSENYLQVLPSYLNCTAIRGDNQEEKRGN